MRYSQPQSLSAQIDWSNPITRGLVFAFIPGLGDATRFNKPASVYATTASRFGKQTLPLNAAPFPEFGVRKIIGTPFSAVIVGTFATAASFTAPILSQFGGNGGWKFGVNSSGNIGYTHYGVADYNTTVPISGFTGSIGMTGGASTSARFFKGGEFREALAVGGISAVGSAGNYSIGSRAASSDALSPSTVACVLYFERALTDAEHASLAANPWQVFEAPQPIYLYQTASGSTGITGNLAVTLGSSTLAATGAAAVDGSLARTLGAATVASTGAVAASGSLVSTLGALSLSGAGTVEIAGSSAITLSPATVTASGTVGDAGINGSLNQTLGATAATSSGTVSIAGSATPTLGAVALASAGSTAITGGATQTLGALTLVASNAEPVAPPVGGGGGVSGGSGSPREVRAFADLLTKARPTKAAKKRLRRVLETEALELLPDEPEAIKAASIIAQVVAKKEVQAIERRPVTAEPFAALPFDPSAMIRQMVEEWLANEAIRQELEDEDEIEMLLRG